MSCGPVRAGDVAREGWPADCDGTCVDCVTRQVDLAVDRATPRRE